MQNQTQSNRRSLTMSGRHIWLVLICSWALATTLGCSDPAVPEQSLGPPNPGQSADSRTGCRPTQNAPYANGIPYLGVHGNPGNSDVIDCETPNAWTRSWHELKGLGMTQPNTFAGWTHHLHHDNQPHARWVQALCFRHDDGACELVPVILDGDRKGGG